MNYYNNKLAHASESVALLHFLREHTAEKLSRFEAYCFLLDKACANYHPQNIEEKWIPAIGKGQFFITKTELADSWHWHRATVRTFLSKLTEFGNLTVEEHLKGMLCTMHHLVILDNPEQAIAYNFDDMARYVMSSYIGGTQDAKQTGILCGQIERSASLLLDGNLLSPDTQRQLKEIRKLILSFAIDKIPASTPGDYDVANMIRDDHMLLTERLYEFFTEHIGGNWEFLFSLISDHTKLALDALTQSINLGREERQCIWNILMEDANIINSVSSDKSICDTSDDADAQEKEDSQGTAPAIQ